MHLLYGVAVVMLLFPWLSHKTRIRIEKRWHNKAIGIFNVRVRLKGEISDLEAPNVMLVANHVSWLDIYVLNAIRPVRFVSKMEVRSWPLVGWLAKRTGTLFIDRTKRHDTARVNQEVSTVLTNGGCVAIFPEGTTTDGREVRKFHSSLLEPAVQSQSRVWPAAIRYIHEDGSLNTAPAYIDDITIGQSLAMILSQKVIHVEVEVLAPIAVLGKTRRDLAREAHLAIAMALQVPEDRFEDAEYSV